MPLHQGYNIVTERVEETESELAALTFFRKAAHDEEIETPITVVGLETLLYNASEDSRGEVLAKLRQVLRGTRSLSSMDAVQFDIDGRIVDDVEFRVRIERSGEGVYLNIGQLFVEEPQPMGATHAVARK